MKVRSNSSFERLTSVNKEITIDELKVALSSGSQLIDVREADEFEAGHIPSAVLVSLGTVPENIDRFRSDANVFLVCHSGGRSMRACEFLHEQGITNVVNVIGGTAGWIALGNPLSIGTQP